MRKDYIKIDHAEGYPVGEHIRFECLACGDVLLSMPEHGAACKCRNVIVDADAGRIAIKQQDLFRAFRI
jgi:hypothetical protein